MKLNIGSISLAALSVAFVMPLAAQTSNPSNQTTSNQTTSNWRAEADQMVPTRAAIVRTLDAKDSKPGTEFMAKLPREVHLKDGSELPAGTVLMGRVSVDDLNESGQSKLALCIDQAKLKDGRTIPVKATIVGVYGPGAGRWTPYDNPPGDQVANDWSKNVAQVDELNALKGIELHSRITSKNSGVLVSTKEENIKLERGTELALAIRDDKAQQGANIGAH
jgi:hypothetical protein